MYICITMSLHRQRLSADLEDAEVEGDHGDAYGLGDTTNNY